MSNTNTLLIEIGTEELPPKGLDKLSKSFLTQITQWFQKLNIPFKSTECFVSPRRLAVRLTDVPSQQPDYTSQKRGPNLKSAFKDEKPTPAAIGFAKSCGVEFTELKTLENEKGSWLVYEQTIKGKPLEELLNEIITQSLESLPLPKKMRWGNHDIKFIRPIHWIAILHGNQPINCEVYSIKSNEYTFGHRYHFPKPIKINHADNYLNVLRDVKVLADYQERKEIISRTSQELARKLNGSAFIDPDLLDTVTGLVEWPVPLLAKFDPAFLNVPKEALISSMQEHQKCFPILDEEDNLLPQFILISNIEAHDPSNIILGNEKVMHARLEDAKFFYTQDSQKTLASHTEALKNMVYQKNLGSLYEKCERVAQLGQFIAKTTQANFEWVEKSAMLSKADLVTHMVFEFPELQGIMGYYYAKKDNEPEEVAIALKEIYLPGHAKDELPQTSTGLTLALAERLDTLAGIFSVGLIPTGEKDPYALRRAAIGILRIIIEKRLNLDLKQLIEQALNNLKVTDKTLSSTVLNFCFDRYKAWYQDQNIAPQVIEAVLSTSPSKPYDMSLRTQAVNEFQSLPEAQSLASANKRVKNILEKNSIIFNLNELPLIKNELLKEGAEIELFEAIETQKAKTEPLIQQGEYQKALNLLASLKVSVDTFFDNVLVMAEDPKLKTNRIHLLTHLYALFMQIADISKLAI